MARKLTRGGLQAGPRGAAAPDGGGPPWDDARHLFYQHMLPMIAYCTPDPYAFSVCKHLLHWEGIFDSPLVRPPCLNAPEWLQRELRQLARQLGLLDRT